jgi:hypothetical protein
MRRQTKLGQSAKRSCFAPPNALDDRRQLAQKGGKPDNMKYLAMLTLAALALSLGACAKKHDETTHSTTHSSASTGYQK